MTANHASSQVTPPIRVILVEDDHDLRQGLGDYLRLNAMEVTDVASGIGYYKAARGHDFDIAILDVNLPDISGFDLAREISAEGQMGVIVLTARAGRMDRVAAYAGGADLYFTKPVDGEELALAIQNLARRVPRSVPVLQAMPPKPAAPQIPLGPSIWVLDAARHKLHAPGGAVIPLSGRELLLMEQLAKAQGAAVTRASLATSLGYDDRSPDSRSLDAVLRRLRQKAAAAGINLPLHAVHAVGIRFSEPLR